MRSALRGSLAMSRRISARRACAPFSVGVIECEAHSEDVVADETLAGVGREHGGVFVTAIVEKVGGDDGHAIARRDRMDAGNVPFRDPHHADNDRSSADPFVASTSGVNCAATFHANPTQTGVPRIPLANRVGGD